MTENVENLILEHLRAIRNDVKEFREETKEEFAAMKQRINSIERSNAGLHEDTAAIQTRLDRLDGRIARVEKRLELSSV